MMCAARHVRMEAVKQLRACALGRLYPLLVPAQLHRTAALGSCRLFAAASGAPPPVGASGAPSQKKGSGAPQLLSPSGAPIASVPGRGSASEQQNGGLGVEMELTQQNAAQVLQNPGAILLQVGELSEAVAKKITRLRAAASGRLPLCLLDCAVLPQICESLQIKSSPTLLLMAKGQVAAALEQDLSPPAATAFVDRVSQMLGLKVELAEGTTEQLAEAEGVEWTEAAAAEEAFAKALEATDLPLDARVRATAGLARCALRLDGGSRREEAKGLLEELESKGNGRQPEVKQVKAMFWLDERRLAMGSASLDMLKAEAATLDDAAVEAYAVALFWAGSEVQAVDTGLALLRRKRSEETRRLVLNLVDALGPRHPHSKSARKSFSSALFI